MSRRRLFGLALIFGVATTLGTRTTRATLLVPSAAADRGARADAVIVGRVESTQAAWSGKQIVTHSVVTTERVVAGAVAPRYEIVIPGGTIDGIGMRVLGGPELHRGARAVLFLSRVDSANHVRHILDLADGALPIERGPDGIDRVRDGGRLRSITELAAELER